MRDDFYFSYEFRLVGDVLLTLVLSLFVLTSLMIIALVMVQPGKSDFLGLGGSAGASTTLFGASGASPILIRFTAALVGFFMLLSLLATGLLMRKVRQQHAMLYLTSEEQSEVEQKIVEKSLSANQGLAIDRNDKKNQIIQTAEVSGVDSVAEMQKGVLPSEAIEGIVGTEGIQSAEGVNEVKDISLPPSAEIETDAK